MSAFADLRVVDLTTRLSGAYAARLFGDYGAQVFLVEPGTGHPLRHEGPFLGNRPGLDRSFLHGYANWNKQSLVAPSAIELEELVASADVLVTTALTIDAELQALFRADAHKDGLILAAEIIQRTVLPDTGIASELNPEIEDQIEAFCDEARIPLLGKIPYDASVIRAMVGRRCAVENGDSAAKRSVCAIWERIEQTVIG